MKKVIVAIGVHLDDIDLAAGRFWQRQSATDMMFT